MYRVYATTEYGAGRVMALGDYDDPSDIEINIGMFSRDVVITIEETNAQSNKKVS